MPERGPAVRPGEGNGRLPAATRGISPEIGKGDHSLTVRQLSASQAAQEEPESAYASAPEVPQVINQALPHFPSFAHTLGEL